jgi:predicted ATP-dependent endonuclease of OLD family
MILESIEIEKFRNLPAGTYPLGKRITVIAGQNATGKSTLLGVIGQGFGADTKDIWGMQLTSKFATKFKLSIQYDSIDYKYYLNTYKELHPEGKRIPVISYRRSKTDTIRLVVGAIREPGHGNIEVPVIFLGLKRVYPLGETTAPKIETDKLTDEERNFFIERHIRILQETSEISPQRFSSKVEKRTLGIETSEYDSMSISAGQDNIGQILGALISLRRVRQQQGENYQGAFLLIDEADVTLHAASQRKRFYSHYR